MCWQKYEKSDKHNKRFSFHCNEFSFFGMLRHFHQPSLKNPIALPTKSFTDTQPFHQLGQPNDLDILAQGIVFVGWNDDIGWLHNVNIMANGGSR